MKTNKKIKLSQEEIMILRETIIKGHYLKYVPEETKDNFLKGMILGFLIGIALTLISTFAYNL